nr:disease resistance protein RPP13-like isoform X6 [Ipomoea batatas]
MHASFAAAVRRAAVDSEDLSEKGGPAMGTTTGTTPNPCSLAGDGKTLVLATGTTLLYGDDDDPDISCPVLPQPAQRTFFPVTSRPFPLFPACTASPITSPRSSATRVAFFTLSSRIKAAYTLFRDGRGKLWELPEDDKFCELIVLEIGETDLEDWKATGHHFPKLEHISLSSCKKLKEIPSGLAEISRLKSIQLRGCCPSVLASAQEIKEEQLDYLNNIVDVVSEPCLMKGSFMKMSFFRRAGGKLD